MPGRCDCNSGSVSHENNSDVLCKMDARKIFLKENLVRHFSEKNRGSDLYGAYRSLMEGIVLLGTIFQQRYTFKSILMLYMNYHFVGFKY